MSHVLKISEIEELGHGNSDFFYRLVIKKVILSDRTLCNIVLLKPHGERSILILPDSIGVKEELCIDVESHPNFSLQNRKIEFLLEKMKFSYTSFSLFV